MTRETRTVLERWPSEWVDWRVALDSVGRVLPWSRRSIANRAAVLVKRGIILRYWVEVPTSPPQWAFITKRIDQRGR